MSDISRRDFLKGAAAGAIGLAASSLTGAVAFADDAPAAEAGLRYDENGVCINTRAEYFAATTPEVGEISSVEDFDIVVIGAGNGGLVAGASAADLGAKVIVVEKNGMYTTWAGEIGAFNTKLEKEKYGVHYTDDELQVIANEFSRYSSGGTDQRLHELYVKNSGRTMDWVIDQLATKDIDFMVEVDMKDTSYLTLPSQHCAFVKGTFTELGPNQLGSQIANPKWIELIEDKGGEVRYNTKALTLVQDEDGKVTGITVQNKDGTFSQLNAAKGVVVSTGGFSGNADMMDVLGVTSHRYAANTMGCAGRMGDGIRMCVNAGAKMDSDCAGGIMLFDRGAVALDHHVGPEYGEALTDVWWPGSQPWLKVNTLGERFCNEDGPYDFQCNAITNQPGGFAYQIFDSDYWNDVNKFHTTICSRVVAFPGSQNSEVLPGIYPVTSGEDFRKVFMQPGLDSGKLKEADTLEDLADQLGIEGKAKETFLATVARYNELAEKGVDEDFGKMARRLTPIKQGPFYGIALSSWILCSITGVNVNTNLQAIRPDGSVIEGLYVVGNDMGGFFRHNYPQMFAGTAHGKTTCFARLATLHAMTGSIYE
ncbi:MAG: FAD-binding protein [Oscillospiraceae bacterium]|nr:FAD-binding protein [Oscillospiraceae bacterium]